MNKNERSLQYAWKDVQAFLESKGGKSLRIPNCNDPLSVPVRRRVDDGGSDVPKDDRHYLTTHRAFAPCGICDYCQLGLKNEWYGKILAEFTGAGAEPSPWFLTLTFSDDAIRANHLDFDAEWSANKQFEKAYSVVREAFLEAVLDRWERRDPDAPSYVYNNIELSKKRSNDVRILHTKRWFMRLDPPVRARFAAANGYDEHDLEIYLSRYRTLEEFRKERRKRLANVFRLYIKRLKSRAETYINNERKRIGGNPSPSEKMYLAELDKYYEKSPRFFFASEYGSLNGRIHYHAILFDWLPCKQEYNFKIVGNKTISLCNCDRCNMINEAWGFGFTKQEMLMDYIGSARYVAKYVMKSGASDPDVPYYYPPNAYGASRSPAIGDRLSNAVVMASIKEKRVEPKGTYDSILENGLVVEGKTYNLGRNALRRIRKSLDYVPGFTESVRNDTAQAGAIAHENKEILADAARVKHAGKREKLKRQSAREAYNREVKRRLKAERLKKKESKNEY